MQFWDRRADEHPGMQQAGPSAWETESEGCIIGSRFGSRHSFLIAYSILIVLFSLFFLCSLICSLTHFVLLIHSYFIFVCINSLIFSLFFLELLNLSELFKMT